MSDSNHTKKLISEWYKEKATRVFQERFEEVMENFEYKNMPKLELLDMKRRWGSFVNKDKIILNPKLIHVPKDCIDYVITHELCHVKYKNHDKKFLQFLDEKYPKWEKVKDKLEMYAV